MAATTPLPAPIPGATPIDVFENVTAEQFWAEIQPRHRPAVMKGLVADWPICRDGDAHTALGRIAGASNGAAIQVFEAPPSEAGRFFYTPDLKGFNFERKTIDVGALIEALKDRADDDGAAAIYGGAINVPNVLPAFGEDHSAGLLPTGTDHLLSVWVGNRTRIPPHWDTPQNIACVAVGRRRFTLFPPEQAKNLYIGPLDFTLAGQPCSLVDLSAPDFGRYPKAKIAFEAARYADLEPGDAIYIPSLWLHQVESFDPIGVLVNTWWRDGPDWMVTPLLSLLHARLTISELPEDERAAWKAMFDHFIFQTDGDPAAHMPDGAKGVLGPLSETDRRQLIAFLAARLR